MAISDVCVTCVESVAVGRCLDAWMCDFTCSWFCSSCVGVSSVTQTESPGWMVLYRLAIESPWWLLVSSHNCYDAVSLSRCPAWPTPCPLCKSKSGLGDQRRYCCGAYREVAWPATGVGLSRSFG